MCHINTEILYLSSDLIDRIEEVHGDEFNPRISPVVGEWSSGGNNDFAPVLCSLD